MNTYYTSKKSKLTDCNFTLKWFKNGGVEKSKFNIIEFFDIFGEKLNFRAVFRNLSRL